MAGLTVSIDPRFEDLLTNGSFEFPLFDDGTPLPGVINPTDATPRTVTEAPTSGDPVYVLDSGATAVLGWEAFASDSGATIDWVHDSVLAASDGERIIDLNGTPGPGGIRQSFDTTPGASYRVLFDLAGNPDELPDDPADFPVKSVRVSAADTSEDYSFDTAGTTTTDMGWETQVFEFIATEATTTLSFESLTPADSAATAANTFADFGPTIDNVGAFLLGAPGDFNGDGAVDNGDLNLLLANWGEPADARPSGWVGAIPTGPAIDNDELNALLANWGVGTAAIPEPAALSLLALVAGAMASARRVRRRMAMAFVPVLAVMTCTTPTDASVIAVNLDTEVSVGDSVPVINPAIAAAAFLSDCPGFSVAGFQFSASNEQGNSTMGFDFNFDYAGAIAEVAGAVEAIANRNPVSVTPTVDLCTAERTNSIVHASGQFSLYSVAAGSVRIRQRAAANVSYTDTIIINSPIATVVELPVRLESSAFASESFGDSGFTRATVTASFTGGVSNAALNGATIDIESVTVIPEQGSIDASEIVEFAVQPGVNTFDVQINGQFEVTADARGGGLFGSIAGASTAGLSLPGSFEIGWFTGPGGSELTDGLTIASAAAGVTYVGEPAPADGDFNQDGRVDNGDLNLLLGSWGDQTPTAGWTAPSTAPIDNDELNALLGNWGFGAAAVPEPISIGYLLFGFTVGARRQR